MINLQQLLRVELPTRLLLEAVAYGRNVVQLFSVKVKVNIYLVFALSLNSTHNIKL